MLDIKDVMIKHIKIDIDKEFLRKIQSYRIGWCNKSDVYVDFLGSNLTGVHNIRFSDYDNDVLFVDILNIDKSLLRTDLYNLKDIHPERKVSSDTYYLTMSYLMYRVSNSKLNLDDKKLCLEELYYLTAYKMISSLYTNYFQYPVDVSIAKAVYEKLSNHYLIKTEGSWQGVFKYRARDVLPNGLWYKKIEKLNTITATKMVADLQGRIRGIIKELFKIILDVKENNEKVNSSSLIDSNDEDGDGIKEASGRPDIYVTYMKGIFNKPNDFINDDLVYLICQMHKNVDRDKLVETLKYISNNVTPKVGEVDIVENVINVSINYLSSKRIVNDYNKKAYEVIVLMKGYWSASSVKDPIVRETKDKLIELSRKATGKKTPWLIASIVICVMLYIFIRSTYRNQH